MAESKMTIKNVKYNRSKKAQAEIIRELEFRNFELEKTLENILALGQLAFKPRSNEFNSVSERHEQIKKAEPSPLESQYIRNFAFKKEIKPELTEKNLDGKTNIESDFVEVSNDFKQIKEELTPEEREKQRKERMASASKKSPENMTNQVLKNTMLHAQVQAEINPKPNQKRFLECSVCSIRNENVGFSQKLQKNYCMSCLQKASFKM